MRGRYLAPEQSCQIVRPLDVVQELMAVVFRAKRFLDANALLVTLSTLLFLLLVILLSLRLREQERRMLFRLGCSRTAVFELQAAELAIVLAAAVALAWLLCEATLPWLAP